MLQCISCSQNSDVGDKVIHYSSRLYIDGADAEVLHPGEIVTFINWGNLRILKVNRSVQFYLPYLFSYKTEND